MGKRSETPLSTFTHIERCALRVAGLVCSLKIKHKLLEPPSSVGKGIYEAPCREWAFSQAACFTKWGITDMRGALCDERTVHRAGENPVRPTKHTSQKG